MFGIYVLVFACVKDSTTRDILQEIIEKNTFVKNILLTLAKARSVAIPP
jgi:hypothetical protein